MATNIPNLLSRPLPANATPQYQAQAASLRTLLRATEQAEPDLSINWAAVMLAEALDDLFESDPTTPGERETDVRFTVVQDILIAAKETGHSFHDALERVKPPGFE